MANVKKEKFEEDLYSFLWKYRASEYDVLKAMFFYGNFYKNKVEEEVKKRESLNKKLNNNLKNKVKDKKIQKTTADITCPDCGGKNFYAEGSCNICVDCGHSACG